MLSSWAATEDDDGASEILLHYVALPHLGSISPLFYVQL